MNIALFPSAFHPSLGGVEELCRQLAHVYRRDGHPVSVWTERWPRNLPAHELYESIPVHRFPMRVPVPAWKGRLSHALTHRHIRARLVRAIRQAGVEVLHVQCVSSTAWYALHVRRTLGIPLVVTLQGELNMDAAGTFQRPGIGQQIMRTALREADAITACSRQTLAEAEAFYGQPFGRRARVIYNGIDTQEFAVASPHRHARPYILAIGRHVREKGFDLLLEAFARAGNLGHDLILAGDGTENSALRTLAEQLGLAGRVHFPGRVDHATAVRFFLGCSFFVLPSRHEPFGIVNLEAMAAGKAIVASRVGGVPEFVEDGDTGLLVEAGDVEALAGALRKLAGGSELREELGSNGNRHVVRFDWRYLAAEYKEVYNSTMDTTAAFAAAQRQATGSVR